MASLTAQQTSEEFRFLSRKDKRCWQTKAAELLRRWLGLSACPCEAQESLLDKVARFVACEKIPGDYLEFGSYNGNSLRFAMTSLATAFHRRILQTDGEQSERDREERYAIWKAMRFFAFDSFQGLPALEGIDAESRDFAEGQYRFSKEDFFSRLGSFGLPIERVIAVPGWFHESCTETTRLGYKIEKASVVLIDCDLYNSAKVALDFITPLLQDGTIIVFDDWFSYRGNPKFGEQRAFLEWTKNVVNFRFVEYQKEGAWRNSFIAAKL